MIKFVALYDLHVGSDYKWINGGWKRTNAHDVRCIKLVKEFVNDYKPEIIIFGGDQLNLYCMSKWTENEILGKDLGALKNEYELFKSLIFDFPYFKDRKIT